MDNMILDNIALLNASLKQESSAHEKIKLTLPQPSDDALAHSEQLLSLIIKKIQSSPQGFIGFDLYMHLVLYEPGLGYYSAGNQKFGESGDFVTAPEISPLFSQCFAQQCYQGLLALGEDACILEIGAGSGKMAADILQELQVLGRLPACYYILELSAELKERQQNKIKAQCPELFPKLQWLDALPASPIKAIILANEVCDAMPVHRFCIKDNAIYELGVKYEDEIHTPFEEGRIRSLRGALVPANKRLIEELNTSILKDDQNFDYLISQSHHNTYISEINLNIKPWIKSLSEVLKAGLIFIIDYGFPQSEYYHPSRHMGTLMCHYRHHAHSDPFLYPGLQDITAHVDFTLIAEAALSNNLEVLGFTNQASFLLGSGLLTLAEKNQLNNMTEQALFKQNQAIQLLTSPAEMGELFKVMVLSKNFDGDLSGFALNDMRYRLG